MIKLLLLLILFSIFYSCKRNKSGYVNHNKWVIEYVYSSNKNLKGFPKEVTESDHYMMSDTAVDAWLPDERTFYTIYKFNPAGDIISMRTPFDSSEFSESQFIYDKDGEQFKIFTHDREGGFKNVLKNQKISKRTGSGRYKEEFYRDGILRYINEVSFLNKGERVVTKRFQGDSLLFTASKYYSNDKILEDEVIQKGASIKRKYYYSDKGFLDSIVYFDNNKSNGRKEIFSNDKDGNTVYYENTGENERISIKYKFDSVGNWVRQLLRYDSGQRFKIDIPGNKFSNYSIIVREIKY